MSTDEFIDIASELVVEYITEREYMLHGNEFSTFENHNITMVNLFYILGNIKAQFIVKDFQGEFFEVTYNKEKNEAYLDGYTKQVNERYEL